MRLTALAESASLAAFSRQHVGGEFLVAENGQAFLQRQLEPVAAGNAVAGPVVEILVRDNGLDVFVIDIGGGVRGGQQQLGVEEVEALVLHRAHVEVGDGHDHEAFEVEFQPEALLIPADGAHQRIHCVFGAVEAGSLGPDLQQHFAAGGGQDVALVDGEVGGHQRKQVGRLEEGVFPAREMSAVG